MQMYTSSRPYAGVSHNQVVSQVVSGISRLHFPADVPPDYEQLASSCMAYMPEDRPTFEEVCEALQALREEEKMGLVL